MRKKTYETTAPEDFDFDELVERFVVYCQKEARRKNGARSIVSRAKGSVNVRLVRQAPEHALIAFLFGELVAQVQRTGSTPNDSLTLGFLADETGSYTPPLRGAKPKKGQPTAQVLPFIRRT